MIRSEPEIGKADRSRTDSAVGEECTICKNRMPPTSLENHLRRKHPTEACPSGLLVAQGRPPNASPVHHVPPVKESMLSTLDVAPLQKKSVALSSVDYHRPRTRLSAVKPAASLVGVG